jgi:hypothetical protein
MFAPNASCHVRVTAALAKGFSMNVLQPAFDAFRGPQRKPTLILLISTVLTLVWRYYCSTEFLAGQFGSVTTDPWVTAAIGNFLSCFVLLGLVPALVVKLVFHERLQDYGVGLGNHVYAWSTFAILAPVFLLAAYLAMNDPQILAKFPINPQAGTSAGMFALHALTYLLFYVGWEFHFRGFLLFGLRSSLGCKLRPDPGDGLGAPPHRWPSFRDVWCYPGRPALGSARLADTIVTIRARATLLAGNCTRCIHLFWLSSAAMLAQNSRFPIGLRYLSARRLLERAILMDFGPKYVDWMG